jgi:hypothetical protein
MAPGASHLSASPTHPHFGRRHLSALPRPSIWVLVHSMVLADLAPLTNYFSPTIFPGFSKCPPNSNRMADNSLS